jgi:hypothetical protein
MTDMISEEEYLAKVAEYGSIKKPTAAQTEEYMDFIADVGRSRPSWAADSTGEGQLPVHEKYIGISPAGAMNIQTGTVEFIIGKIIDPFGTTGSGGMADIMSPDNFIKTIILDGEDLHLTPYEFEASMHESGEYALYEKVTSKDATIGDLKSYLDLTEGRTDIAKTIPLGDSAATGEPFNIGDYTIYIIIAVAVIALMIILKR